MAKGSALAVVNRCEMRSTGAITCRTRAVCDGTRNGMLGYHLTQATPAASHERCRDPATLAMEGRDARVDGYGVMEVTLERIS